MINKETIGTSLKWSVLGQIVPQLLTPLVSIYIVRILSPEIFGVFAAASMVIAFVRIFMTGTFTEALIQKESTNTDLYKSADFVFSLNLLLSLFLFIIVIISAPSISKFFKNPEIKWVTIALSFGLLIDALGNVQLALLQKGMNFKSIFLRQLVPILSLMVITLPLVWFGLGIWGIVYGTLVSQMLSSYILWIKSDWKPRINFKFIEHKDLIVFGGFIIIESLLAWVVVQGDNLIVGRYLSMHELGLYKTGYDLDTKMFLLFLAPMTPVLYSKLCSLATIDQKNELYKKIKYYISLVVFPIIAGIILISSYFDYLILGSKWEGIGYIMAMLAINPGISFLWILFPQYMRSLGKPQISTYMTMIGVLVFIPVYLISVQFGLKIFIFSRVLVGIVGIILFTYFENRELGLSIFSSLKLYLKPLFSSLIMFVVGLILQELLFNSYTILSLISIISFSIITYGVSMYVFSKMEIIALINILVKKEL